MAEREGDAAAPVRSRSRCCWLSPSAPGPCVVDAQARRRCWQVEAREPPMSGWPVITTDRAVLVDAHLGARFAAGVEPVAARHAAALIGLERPLFSADGQAPAFTVLLVAHDRIDRTVHRLGALLAAFFRRSSSGSHPELLGQLIEHALDGIGADRRAGRAVGATIERWTLRRSPPCGRLDVVGPKAQPARRGSANRKAPAWSSRCPGATIVPSFLAPILTFAHRTEVGRRRGTFFARHHHLDRLARTSWGHTSASGSR